MAWGPCEHSTRRVRSRLRYSPVQTNGRSTGPELRSRKPSLSAPKNCQIRLDPVAKGFPPLVAVCAMQLCYDCFGPLFRLGQDKWTRKYREDDPDAPPGLKDLPQLSIGWHSCVCHPLRGVWLLSPRHGCWCLAVTARLASRRCGSTCRSTRSASGEHRPCPLRVVELASDRGVCAGTSSRTRRMRAAARWRTCAARTGA